MKELYFENQGPNNFLVYEIGSNEIVDSLSLGMLTNNKIPGLATTIFMQIDAQKYIKYNVSAKIPVRQFFSGSVTKKRLLGVFSGIINALLSAEDYMLDINTIMLDMNCMFADVSTCETNLICLPLEKATSKNVNFPEFFRSIMFNTQFDQTENVDYVARIINYLNNISGFSLLGFKNVIDTLNKEGEKAIKVSNVQPSGHQINIPVKEQEPLVISKIPSAEKNVVTPQESIKKMDMQIQQMKPEGNQKQISLFYLLQHYNKENAAAYKKQKEVRKQRNTTSVVSKEPSKEVQEHIAMQSANLAFAIPGVSTIPPQPTTQPITLNQPQAKTPVLAPILAPQPTSQATCAPQSSQGPKMNFGETTVLGGGGRYGETTVLSEVPQQNQIIIPYLIRIKNNEKIMLDKPVFRIGKERSFVDYFIGDNTAVSRSHSNIVTREGNFFIIDTNSLNHTFVNGVIIQNNVEVKLAHGDKISMANEEFEFKLK